MHFCIVVNVTVVEIHADDNGGYARVVNVQCALERELYIRDTSALLMTYCFVDIREKQGMTGNLNVRTVSYFDMRWVLLYANEKA